MSGVPAEMTAAVLRSPGVVELETRQVPSPGVGQVLIQVDYCGICGSDVHLLHQGWGRPGLVAGHEVAGRVVALGPDTSRWRPGDQVVVGPAPRCGRCRRCLEGQPSQCENRSTEFAEGANGAFAGFTVAPESALLALPEGLSPRVAALAEPLAVALHGITRAGVLPEDRVMIFGAGPIGVLSLAVLAQRGHRDVTVVEPNPGRARLAREVGASSVLDPSELQSFDRFAPQEIADRSAHVVLECSGQKAAMEAGLEQLAKGGTLCLVGAGVDHPTFDPNRILLNELTIRGSFVYDADGFQRALELLATGLLPTHLLIEPADIPLSGLNRALAGLAGGSIAGKVMVDPSLDREGR